MVFGVAHYFHSSTAGDHFGALGDGLSCVVRAFRLHIGANFSDDRAHIRLRENYHGIDIGQSSQNLSAFVGRYKRSAFTFQRSHRSIAVDRDD
jgi:hypothetical protein